MFWGDVALNEKEADRAAQIEDQRDQVDDLHLRRLEHEDFEDFHGAIVRRRWPAILSDCWTFVK